MKLFDVYPINPINIVKGRGSLVYDDKGQEYLDLYGGHAVISIGHTNPHYVKRLEDQLHQIGFYSNSVEIPLQKELAEKLGHVSCKEDYQLFLCNSEDITIYFIYVALFLYFLWEYSHCTIHRTAFQFTSENFHILQTE